ncbi:hypothetical protein NQ036_09245 [Brevibacterium sp. 91QC2O2]|uniref:hypothetical protein n=1 Tax=Brevibacterium sp. 91QC2O2 TaxID=2968458 RepID=UPI00211CA440|nr:hypothetical protein [Brevibacterium sp. 91QC2O2]
MGLLPRTLSRSGLDRLGTWLLALPVWLQALAVYAASRVVSLFIMAAAARRQGPSWWTEGESAPLRVFLNFWDAGWYERIATEGYPSVLPLRDDGSVGQSSWAFYPLHPWLAGWTAQVTGLDYQLVSPLLSTLYAAGAAVLVLHLFRLHASAEQALTGLAVTFFFPAAVVFNTGYAEALTFLLLAAALLLVARRHYLWAIPVVFLMDLSRPIGVAFSFFMLVHLVSRSIRRRDEAYPVPQIVCSWALGVLSCCAALVHPVAAWIVTGQPRAYFDTESAWTGHSQVFVQWVRMSEDLAGSWGPVLLAVLLVGLAGMIFGPAGRLMGLTGQLFVSCYVVYLLLFFTPQTSTLRLMLPMFPLSLVLAKSRSWTNRIVVLVLATVLQIVFVQYLWAFSPGSIQPP